ncbi:MAG TPA: hydrogenase expression/formation protein HypE, partial [Vicinamibacteria bacterium]|nr:hydrogenase expression/formation protein HypE [Vicinamibacteria bacterium]
MSQATFPGACPLPRAGSGRILLAHGGGGRLTQRLVEEVFLPAFANPALLARHDGAVLEPPSASTTRLAFSTDSYVVRPLFFPGGDIGTLAICGTVNDLAMCGARPLWLSAGFILEEGFPIEDLRRVADSMGATARSAGVALVTGDTKVVDRGKGDGLFVNTSGIGVVEAVEPIGPAQVRPGDVLLLSGDLGRHGTAILAAREGLGFESAIESDCASLAAPVLDLVRSGVALRCLRDLTRGGLAAALVEIAEASRRRIVVDETQVPVRDDVAAACELLGLDPLYVANEGKLVAFCVAEDAGRLLAAMRADALGADA